MHSYLISAAVILGALFLVGLFPLVRGLFRR